MKNFLSKFNQEYDLLYNSDVNNHRVAGSREALAHFDNGLTEKEKLILTNFVKYRQDFISSDREIIAFMFTLDSFI